jgi:hypothetical protein
LRTTSTAASPQDTFRDEQGALMPYVYMRFTFDKRWTCDFTNKFTQRRVRTLHFTDAEKIRELAQRGKALTDLSSKNNFEHAVRNGGGGVILELSEFQYDKLIGKDC